METFTPVSQDATSILDVDVPAKKGTMHMHILFGFSKYLIFLHTDSQHRPFKARSDFSNSIFSN
jgi:hypothetical protein